MTYAGWHILGLKFSGKSDSQALLDFAPGLSLVYGASNTGKSFALKALDFMLGGSRDLPNIKEREPYDRLFLDVAFTSERSVVLERALVGGSFLLRDGSDAERTLAPRHSANTENNISTYLLSQMQAEGRRISVDASGTPGNLSFRDIANVVLTDETAIQSEFSPIESGSPTNRTRERSAFKFILTGEDDSAIVPVIKPKDFRTGRAARVSMLEEMIDEIEADISADYPDVEGLTDQSKKLDETLENIHRQIRELRQSISALLDEKRRLSTEIAAAERRSTEIALSISSFSKLDEVYGSDLARLEALEEVGFLLAIEGEADCPICGAKPESQEHSHGLDEIEKVQVAAEIEIEKITRQRTELLQTVEDTVTEDIRLTKSIAELRESLSSVEDQLLSATPDANEQQRVLSEVLLERDQVRDGLDLVARLDRLTKQKEQIERTKPPKRDSSIQLGLSTETAKDFADTISEVLLAWGFPGRKQVVFDLSTYDLIIDGKERRNNGKGVRAITHAAFKVALMLFCRERGLPHPGFLVLDTPLLTYRDPMKKEGDSLAQDEQELQNSDMKERFFDHLGELGEKAQIVVLENIDPPKEFGEQHSIEAFTNDPDEGRQGLL